MKCPNPAELERGYWSKLDDVRSHAVGCTTCAPRWREIEQLVAIGSELEPSPSWDRREDVRTTLLSSITRPVTARRAWWPLPAAALAAAAALVVWWQWPARPDAPVAQLAQRRSMVLDHHIGDRPGRHLLVSSLPDEVVRVVDGSFTISIAGLAPGERFRTVTGDAEIIASDAGFDISARSDRIEAVRAIRGQVTVIAAGTQTVLRTGESWRATTKLAVADPTPPAQPAASPQAPSAVTTSRIPSSDRPSDRPTAPSPDHTNDHATDHANDPGGSAANAPAAPTPPPARSMAQQAIDDGWTALRSGDFPAAAKAFERALTVTSDQRVIEDVTFWRGVALARAGEVVTAARVLGGFLTAYPRSPRAAEASVMLGWIVFERGDPDLAEQYFRAGTTDASVRVRDSAAAGLRAVTERRRTK